jgi:oligogalacturonide lyase
MRLNALALGAFALASAMSATAPPPSSSEVGRRFPPERRTIVDAVTGATITALTTSTARDEKIYQTHPQWTPDGKFLIFLSGRAGDGQQAFALSEETGAIIQLTNTRGAPITSLSPARKSNRLYLLRGDQFVELALDPLLTDSRSGAAADPARYERVLLSLPEGMEDCGGFSLDADERRAYLGVRLPRQDRWGIRSIDLRSGALTAVIDLPFQVGHVQANPWASDEILYCHETGGDAPQRMWLVRSDGSDNRPLYRETPDEWVTHEVWVDRDHVLFNLAAGEPRLRTKPTGIALIDVRTQEMTLIGQVGGRGFWHCAATPDLKWAVGDTSGGELYLINIANGERTLLTTGHRPRGAVTHPHQNFSADGKRVLFNSGLLGSSDLMSIPVPTAAAHP